MNIKALVACGLLLYSQTALTTPIKLESKLLSMADGTFFHADIVEMLRMFQRRVSEILIGKLDENGNRVGMFLFNGSYYGSRELAQLEVDNDLQNDPELQAVLALVKAAFLTLSKEFESAIRGTKNITIILIEESCEKRERYDSLLLEWSKTDEGHEDAIFDQRVTTFAAFDQFCVDLLNFFSDLIHSCPKAQKQFKDRLEKWKKFKTTFNKVKSDTTISNENAFLKHVKTKHLDKLSLDDITEKKVKQLLSAF